MSQFRLQIPPRARPLPLETWLAQSDRSEHGREAFFGGRTEEFAAFRRSALTLSEGRVGGETIIVQGAPGAGKTALMLEWAEAVRRCSTIEAPWVAVLIEPDILASADDTLAAIREHVASERIRLAGTASPAKAVASKAAKAFGRAGRNLSERCFRASGTQVGAKPAKERTAAWLFRKAAPTLKGVCIVAFVDEAQNIPVRESTKATIDRLHRGTDGIALLPIFFGLGNTERILGECGISRPESGRLWELRPMGEDETAESLGAVFDAYGFGLPGPERDRWISELAKESHGWPQHLNRVAVSAGKAIQRSGFDLRLASLDEAVLVGRRLKDEYYEMLLGRGADCPDLYKGLALAADLGSGVLSRGEIERLAFSTLKRIGLDVDSFLDNSLHAGLLSPTTSGRYEYRFPIPSLAQFLRQLPIDPAGNTESP